MFDQKQAGVLARRMTQSFRFPKRQFGSKGKERSFRVEWCNAPGSGSHFLLSTKLRIYILAKSQLRRSGATPLDLIG